MLVKNGLPRVINEIKNKQFRERERVLKVDTIIREEIRRIEIFSLHKSALTVKLQF